MDNVLALVALLMLLGGLCGLLLKVRGDARSPAAPESGEASGRRFARWCVAFGLAAFAWGVEGWINPVRPPFSGGRRFVQAWAYEIAGDAGMPLFWFGVAVCWLLAARAVWRHTPKKPGSRLFF